MKKTINKNMKRNVGKNMKKNVRQSQSQSQTYGTKILAGVFTVLILGFLIISGPADAFNLSFGIDGAVDGKYTASKGEIVKFTASIDINDVDANLPIEELKIVLDGPENVVCKFDVNGNTLEFCEGFSIKRVASNVNYGYGYGYGYGYDNGYYDFGYGYGYNYDDDNYGYGYGYGYGYDDRALVYEITLDTEYFELGEYETEFRVKINDKWFSEEGDILIIIDNDDNDGNGGDDDDGTDDDDDNDDDNGDGGVIDVDGEDNDETLIDKIIEPVRNFLSRITGAVVGALGKTGTVVAGIFLVGIFGFSVAIRVVRKRRGL